MMAEVEERCIDHGKWILVAWIAHSNPEFGIQLFRLHQRLHHEPVKKFQDWINYIRKN